MTPTQTPALVCTSWGSHSCSSTGWMSRSWVPEEDDKKNASCQQFSIALIPQTMEINRHLKTNCGLVNKPDSEIASPHSCLHLAVS